MRLNVRCYGQCTPLNLSTNLGVTLSSHDEIIRPVLYLVTTQPDCPRVLDLFTDFWCPFFVCFNRSSLSVLYSQTPVWTDLSSGPRWRNDQYTWILSFDKYLELKELRFYSPYHGERSPNGDPRLLCYLKFTVRSLTVTFSLRQ